MKKVVLLTATALMLCMIIAGGYLVSEESAIEVTAAAGSKRIVIDAGHGQPDGGAVGSTAGVIEEQINLSIAKKLQTLLAEQGWEVIMTRENEKQIGEDKNADMRRRREIISGSGEQLTISIHQNFYAGNAAASGPQVFYAAGSEQGKLLAEQIQTALNAALEPSSPRIAAEGDYYIVKSGSTPSVIVECGFLSDPAEEKLLMQSQYQLRIAKAIAKGITEYCAKQ